MTPATGRFYEAVVNGALPHNGDRQLAQHVANWVIREDAAGARLTKRTELRPHAVDGVVYNDVGSRTPFVRLPDAASGHDRSLWRQAHQLLLRAEQSGWPVSAPWLWAHAPGKLRVAHGLPGDAGTIKFHFYPGDAAYVELVGKPGLRAFVVIDRGSCHFLHVTFRHGLEPA